MDENFIPWEQIEPLVRDGMTGRDLKAKLCELIGLDPLEYYFHFPGSFAFESLVTCIRRGCYVRKGQPRTPFALDEPVS